MSGSGVPKILWVLWLQGWDTAPPVVQTCLSTWRNRNPDWEVRALTQENVGAYLTIDLPLDGCPPAALSDIYRVFLLRKFGGVWVDSTLYCAAPLDSWLGANLDQGFFAFARPGPDRMLASWFLAAEARHPLIGAWADLVTEYWSDRSKPDRYFWFHHLFADAYRRDPAVRRVWDAVPKISANGPHYFAPDYESRLFRQLRPHVRQRVLSGVDSVYKLTHRLEDVPPPRESAYELLRSWADEPFVPPLNTPPALASALALDRGVERLRWGYLNGRQRLRLLRRRCA